MNLNKEGFILVFFSDLYSMNTLTAKQLFSDLQNLPTTEREQFFVLLAGTFDKKDDNFTHDQVFGHLQGALFTAVEAAEYLEISMATFRRLLKAGSILANTEIGANHLYSLDDLRQFKKARSLVKHNLLA